MKCVFRNRRTKLCVIQILFGRKSSTKSKEIIIFAAFFFLFSSFFNFNLVYCSNFELQNPKTKVVRTACIHLLLEQMSVSDDSDVFQGTVNTVDCNAKFHC